MTRYIVELRNAWGRQLYCVIDTTRGHHIIPGRAWSNVEHRTVARCDTHADAANVCSAMNAYNAAALEAQK